MLGFRVWFVSADPSGSGPFYLRSPWRGDLWQGRTMASHLPPAEDNDWGVYSRTRYANDQNFSRIFGPDTAEAWWWTVIVRGTVRLGGRVVEHDDGTLRAEEATVERLGMPRLSGKIVAIPDATRAFMLFDKGGSQLPAVAIDPRTMLSKLLARYDAKLLVEWPWDAKEGS